MIHDDPAVQALRVRLAVALCRGWGRASLVPTVTAGTVTGGNLAAPRRSRPEADAEYVAALVTRLAVLLVAAEDNDAEAGS